MRFNLLCLLLSSLVFVLLKKAQKISRSKFHFHLLFLFCEIIKAGTFGKYVFLLLVFFGTFIHEKKSSIT